MYYNWIQCNITACYYWRCEGSASISKGEIIINLISEGRCGWKEWQQFLAAALNSLLTQKNATFISQLSPETEIKVQVFTGASVSAPSTGTVTPGWMLLIFDDKRIKFLRQTFKNKHKAQLFHHFLGTNGN